MAKCEYICLSAEEMEKLKKNCDSTSKTTKKKKTTKTTKKKTAPKSKAVSKPKKAAQPKRKAVSKPKRATPSKKTVKVTKKKKIVNKNRNSNRNVNNNNNVVSVNVRSNPKAVSNVYIVRPSQPVMEAPRKKKESIPYDAPFLPRRTPDGGLIQTASAPRQRTVYVQAPSQPEIIVEQEQSSGRSVGGSAKKVLSAGAKAGRGIVSAGRNAIGRSRSRSNRTQYEVEFPVAVEPATTVPALPSPSSKVEVLPADYELPKDTKKV